MSKSKGQGTSNPGYECNPYSISMIGAKGAGGSSDAVNPYSFSKSGQSINKGKNGPGYSIRESNS